MLYTVWLLSLLTFSSPLSIAQIDMKIAFIYLFIFSKGGAGLVRHREEIKKADITVNRLYVFERLQGETN